MKDLREMNNVLKTRELDLCTSCEICLAICPKEAISMECRYGQFLPKIDQNRCINCKTCLTVCPGIDYDSNRHWKKSITINDLVGSYLDVYSAHTKDLKIRNQSASGGLITSLVIELLQNGEYESAFLLDFDTFRNKPARSKPIHQVKEVITASKSKYIPASVYEIVITLKKEDKKKYIIVGTPCQILGIKKFLKKSHLKKRNLLFLGLFCDKTLNFNIIRYFEERYKRSGENLTKIDFRNKESRGWPGDTKLYFDSGRIRIVNNTERMNLKPYFQLNRCVYCLDKLNKLADISFGDCYIKRLEDKLGKSSVI
ncbi:MAG: Coenzyme F420 hydrogenase/dehydrogenase, beta subunit C-terminal domain, partial [Promethearchaeota archaeon]